MVTVVAGGEVVYLRKQLLLLERTQSYSFIVMSSDTIYVLVNSLEIDWVLLLRNLLGYLLLLRLTLCLTLLSIIIEIKHTISFFRSLRCCENTLFSNDFVNEI